MNDITLISCMVPMVSSCPFLPECGVACVTGYKHQRSEVVLFAH